MQAAFGSYQDPLPVGPSLPAVDTQALDMVFANYGRPSPTTRYAGFISGVFNTLTADVYLDSGYEENHWIVPPPGSTIQ